MRTLSGLGVLLLVGAAVARPARAPIGTAPTHVVEIRNFAFVPAHMEVARGDTVIWINRDAAPHTATDSLARWDSGELRAGDRWTWVASEAGRFSYDCTYHPSMRGTITVGAVEKDAHGSDDVPEQYRRTP